MQHVEEVVLHQRLDHQLVQVVLKGMAGKVSGQSRRARGRHGPAGRGTWADLHADLEVVERANVLHQHGDGQLVGGALHDKTAALTYCRRERKTIQIPLRSRRDLRFFPIPCKRSPGSHGDANKGACFGAPSDFDRLGANS